MKRRTFISAAALGMAGASIGYFWPDEGLFNPCVSALPQAVKDHELFTKIWQGIDISQMWDCHTHLVGVGDSEKSIWIDPDMVSVWHLKKYIRYKFYMDGSCADEHDIDNTYIDKLVRLHSDFPNGFKMMLLAFDYHHTDKGKIDKASSPFYISNDYASALTSKFPKQFEWIASIHPYREDAVEELERVVKKGARAIKWLPPVMGIDPSSSRCDNFYAALLKYNIPILSHTGKEEAVANVSQMHLGNPLLLRRPLEQGVKIIMAHSACEGASVDIDKNQKTNMVENFELFKRMLHEKKYEEILYGEISAITQINRMGKPLEELVTHHEWHHRLINGSDYPLPGVMPVYSLKKYINLNYLTEYEAKFLHHLRHSNPLLFDFALKRLIRIKKKQFSPEVFQSKRAFM